MRPGPGLVGAANAVAIALARDEAGQPHFNVIGIDLPNPLGRERAGALNAGRFPFATADQALMAAAELCRRTGNLRAVTDEAALREADIIVVDIGLDLKDKSDRPTFRIEPFRAALASVARYMRPDALILMESTVPPGTSEHIAVPALRAGLSERGHAAESLLFAYCYERVMTGAQYLTSITNMDRVYAGLTAEAADRAERFLSCVVSRPLKRLANLRSVELAKVLENTYRAVNIALIDEWERFARRIDVDLFEVLEAIRVRPSHSNIRYPGLGVGGYCLTKDPMFGPAAAREIFGLEDLDFPISMASVRINDAMPSVTADTLEKLLPGGLNGRRVLILGASYLADVGDTRSSPSATLLAALIDRGASVELSDPLVESFEDFAVPCHRHLPSPDGYDAIVFAVAHREFRDLDVLGWLGAARPLVFDSNGVLDIGTLQRIRAAGMQVAAIGRGAIA